MMEANDKTGSAGELQRISIFPLSGALLFPGMHLPLHIFEDRYRALVSDAMARDRRIGMIQPKGLGTIPTLYSVGCLGRIEEVQAHEDGRYDIVLGGLQRFTIENERDVATPFRQVDGRLWDEAEEDEVLASVERASFEMEARAFADRMGYSVDWEGVSRLDDYALINGAAQVVPFDAASKQALIEVRGLAARAELIAQLLQFFSAREGPTDPATLQ